MVQGTFCDLRNLHHQPISVPRLRRQQYCNKYAWKFWKCSVCRPRDNAPGHIGQLIRRLSRCRNWYNINDILPIVTTVSTSGEPQVHCCIVPVMSLTLCFITDLKSYLRCEFMLSTERVGSYLPFQVLLSRRDWRWIYGYAYLPTRTTRE